MSEVFVTWVKVMVASEKAVSPTVPVPVALIVNVMTCAVAGSAVRSAASREVAFTIFEMDAFIMDSQSTVRI